VAAEYKRNLYPCNGGCARYELGIVLDRGFWSMEIHVQNGETTSARASVVRVVSQFPVGASYCTQIRLL
jgi:hypothetical protein